jgi:AraC-like DNA-binding protein
VYSEQVIHPSQAFRFLRFEVPAFAGELHRHRHVELTWIESGAGLRFVGDNASAFESGDLVLIGSQTPHGWVSAPDTAPHRATVVQWAPVFLAQPGLPELAALAPLMERAGVGLSITGMTHTRITEQLIALRNVGAVSRLAGLFTIFDALTQSEPDLTPIAHSAIRGNGPNVRSDTALRRIDRVLEWIHRELARPLTIAEGAAIARVTPQAFSRYFRTAVGKPFTQYTNDVRCGEASLRLRRSDAPINTIAADCGFETLSHFNQQFRRRTGVTPRAFRQQFSPRLSPPSRARGRRSLPTSESP